MTLVESFSGIRGIYGQSITKEIVYKYAFLYAKLFLDKNSIVIVARDTRISGLEVSSTVIEAFNDFGVAKIIDLGIVPIQVCEYYILKSEAKGGIYITASHNEPEYNGFKILKEDGSILYAEQMQKLIEAVHQNKNIATQNKETIEPENQNKKAIGNYINHILDYLGSDNLEKIKQAQFKILLDPNGGSAINVLSSLCERLGVEAEVIHNKLGEFNRLVEPNSESLKYLEPQLKNSDYKFAAGFDCDADRVELVLPSGQTLSGQYVLALAADSFLADTDNQIVVTNDCTSYLVSEVIEKYKAKTIEVEVGETNVVKEMEIQKSGIGGEGSNGGVVVFPIKCRDGIMTMALILKMMAQRSGDLISILSKYPKYYSDRVKVNCSAEEVVEIKNKIEEQFQVQGLAIQKTGDDTGGLKIMFDDKSYLWFRQSKTEAGAFRIIADGDEVNKVKNILKQGIDLFNEFKK